MEQKLDLILQKLESLDEVKEIVLAIRDRQEETDAKLEALSMDVHKVYGKITDLEDKLAFNSYKNYQNEAEIFKLKREFGTDFNTNKE